MDGSKEVESGLSPGALWLARYHADMAKLHRWAPDPLLALRLPDDSMETATWGPGNNYYPKGCTVVIDPRAEWQAGSREVVVEAIDGSCTFRKLELHGKEYILKPINPAYATTPFPIGAKIRGVVVQVRIQTNAGRESEAEWAERQAAAEVANV